MPEIPILLQAEPEVGWHLQHPGSRSGVRGDAALPMDQPGRRRSSGRAYLALARNDSAGAERLFQAIPDTLCLVGSCFFEKLTLARLLAARGQDRRALEILEQWGMVGYLGGTCRQRFSPRWSRRESPSGWVSVIERGSATGSSSTPAATRTRSCSLTSPRHARASAG
jgi:hypothetical protein